MWKIVANSIIKVSRYGVDGRYYVADHYPVGISRKMMQNDFRGEVVYQAETDIHFPYLTVGQTLQFASLARTPRNRMPGVSRQQYASHLRDVVMALFGLTHTVNTKVGNDFVRGVSGGERKRVSIAEVTLSQAPLQCWDNSTRGLDSATALQFVKTLRQATSLTASTAVVAIYQASQDAYDVSRTVDPNSAELLIPPSARSLIKWPSCTKAAKFTLGAQRTPKGISPIWDIDAWIARPQPISSPH